MDEDGHLLLNQQSQKSQSLWKMEEECLMHSSDDDDDDDKRHECDTTDTIIMANFRLYGDTMSKSTSSPVHALSDCSMWVRRIHWLHEERKRLAMILHASRKELYADDLFDHDGFGELFAGKVSLDKFDGVDNETNVSNKDQISSSPISTQTTDMDNNFGLGVTVSAVTSISTLATAMHEKLKPYYSPEKYSSEELYYEIYSFAAVEALRKFLGPTHCAWAVRCSSTTERLRMVHDWMTSHVNCLKEQLGRSEE